MTAGGSCPAGSGCAACDAHWAGLRAHDGLVRDILEALCRRDGLSLDSQVAPGEPARNYELALRLRIGHVFGLRPGG